MLRKWLEAKEAKKRKEQSRKLAERHQMYIDDLRAMYESLNA